MQNSKKNNIIIYIVSFIIIIFFTFPARDLIVISFKLSVFISAAFDSTWIPFGEIILIPRVDDSNLKIFIKSFFYIVTAKK